MEVSLQAFMDQICKAVLTDSCLLELGCYMLWEVSLGANLHP